MILIDKKTFLEIPGKTSCKSYRQTLFFSHHLSHEQPPARPRLLNLAGNGKRP
jgi:hypothetical protein